MSISQLRLKHQKRDQTHRAHTIAGLRTRRMIHGGAFDWSIFKTLGDKLFNFLAPITSKIAGPIATALTGVPMPNLANLKAEPAKFMEEAKTAFSSPKINEGLNGIAQSLVQSLLGKGVTAPKARKRPVKAGAGFNVLA